VGVAHYFLAKNYSKISRPFTHPEDSHPQRDVHLRWRSAKNALLVALVRPLNLRTESLISEFRPYLSLLTYVLRFIFIALEPLYVQR